MEQRAEAGAVTAAIRKRKKKDLPPELEQFKHQFDTQQEEVGASWFDGYDQASTEEQEREKQETWGMSNVRYAAAPQNAITYMASTMDTTKTGG